MLINIKLLLITFMITLIFIYVITPYAEIVIKHKKNKEQLCSCLNKCSCSKNRYESELFVQKYQLHHVK